MLHTLLALLGPFLLAGQSAAAAQGTQASNGLACEIRTVESGGSLLLQAVVTSATAASGDYEFVIAKSGGGGSSNVSQGGDFEIGPGEELVLGETTLGPSDRAQVEADLTVTSTDGRLSCTDRFPRRL